MSGQRTSSGTTSQELAAALRRQETTNAVLAGIARIFREALTCRTHEDLGRVCLAVAEEATRSRFGFIAEINPRTGRLDDIAISDPGKDTCAMRDPSGHGRNVPVGFEVHGVYGRVLLDGKGFFTNDPSSHPDSVGTPPGHPPLEAFLGVPLGHAGRTFGVLGLGNREGGYGPEELESAEALAPAIVQAILGTRAEAALRESEERLSAHLDNSPLAVVEFDPEFRIRRWSRQAERVFGWTAEEMVGRAIAEIRWVHEEDVASVARESAGLFSGERPRSLHVNRNYRKDGSVIHCEWYNSAIYGAGGRLLSVLSQVLDVTARKENEEQLRESDRRKNEFLAVLSHELRNPLAPIMNSLHLLDRAPPGSDRAVRARGILRRQTEHLARLVDDLLDVTRISRGKIELQRERFDARDVVRRTCDDHCALFHERGVELRVETSGPVWIEADVTRVAQVVGNLLQNAAKFCSQGGAVTARIGSVDGRAEIRVCDDGAGIAPDLLPRVFEPFVQADGGLARTKGGLGLGLALVRGLVELHGGSVRAHSEGAGCGSEIVVTLPLAPSPERRAGGAAPAAPGRAMEILIIEDNPDAAQSLAEVLQLEGHRVHVANDGRSGIARARELGPEVILCDIGLPDVDGYQVARTLRGEGLRAARLIAFSGYARPEDRKLAREAGFDDHLAKPCSLEALLASVASARVL